jgi:hypothetical protein
MGLMKCTACGREISEAAAACPGCGHPAPKRSSSIVKYGGGFLLALVAGILVLGFLAPGQSARQTKALSPECAKSATCAADWAGTDLTQACRTAIAARAKYSMRWIDGVMTEPAFSRVSWAIQAQQVLMVAGDLAEFQVEQGHYLRHSYICEYDLQTKRVVQARAWPGKWGTP